MSDPAIGIDLGTTYCCVAVVVNGKVEIIPNREQGTRLTPSYVAYPPNAKETYGTVAKEQAFRYPEDTIFDAKRIIGRHWDDPVLQQDINTWPFEVTNVKNSPKIKTGGKTRYPQEISARLLSKLTKSAETYLGKTPGTIHKAVITVPAYFSEGQRRATIEAGEAAGLEVLTILNEPTAAAIAYKFQRRDSKPRTALVYDLGGGTFDVAIVKVTEDKVDTLGVDGDTHLGGQDFDNLLVKYCAEEFKKEHGVNLLDGSKESARPLSRLRYQCEKAKQSLSATEDVTIDVQSIYKGKDLTVDVTREKFESLIKPLMGKSIDIVQRAIKDTKGINGKQDINDVILIGGSTRIPLCTKMLQKFFDGQMVNCAINPDEAVAYGAAVQASLLNAQDKNDDKCEIERFTIQDVTPKTIGIKCLGDIFSAMIPKNHAIPCKISSKEYRTSGDNQTTVPIGIYQGENPVATKNEKLGEFDITGIPPGPMGKEHIEVTMEFDKNGILKVTATSVSSGSSNGITIEDDRICMPKDAIQRLVEELKI